MNLPDPVLALRFLMWVHAWYEEHEKDEQAAPC